MTWKLEMENGKWEMGKSVEKVVCVAGGQIIDEQNKRQICHEDRADVTGHLWLTSIEQAEAEEEEQEGGRDNRNPQMANSTQLGAKFQQLKRAH